MSNKATATMSGSNLIVKTGVSKTIRVNSRVADSKTGTTVSLIGKVTAKALKCPFVFLDLNTLETRRHSAAYIAKNIG